MIFNFGSLCRCICPPSTFAMCEEDQVYDFRTECRCVLLEPSVCIHLIFDVQSEFFKIQSWILIREAASIIGLNGQFSSISDYHLLLPRCCQNAAKILIGIPVKKSSGLRLMGLWNWLCIFMHHFPLMDAKLWYHNFSVIFQELQQDEILSKRMLVQQETIFKEIG